MWSHIHVHFWRTYWLIIICCYLNLKRLSWKKSNVFLLSLLRSFPFYKACLGSPTRLLYMWFSERRNFLPACQRTYSYYDVTMVCHDKSKNFLILIYLLPSLCYVSFAVYLCTLLTGSLFLATAGSSWDYLDTDGVGINKDKL